MELAFLHNFNIFVGFLLLAELNLDEVFGPLGQIIFFNQRLVVNLAKSCFASLAILQ